jgi:hypothetical protein
VAENKWIDKFGKFKQSKETAIYLCTSSKICSWLVVEVFSGYLIPQISFYPSLSQKAPLAADAFDNGTVRWSFCRFWSSSHRDFRSGLWLKTSCITVLVEVTILMIGSVEIISFFQHLELNHMYIVHQRAFKCHQSGTARCELQWWSSIQSIWLGSKFSDQISAFLCHHHVVNLVELNLVNLLRVYPDMISLFASLIMKFHSPYTSVVHLHTVCRYDNVGFRSRSSPPPKLELSFHIRIYQRLQINSVNSLSALPPCDMTLY